MAEYKATVEPFDNHGMILKLDSAALQLGQFQQLFNMSSVQEKSLSICRGTQRKNNSNPISGLAHTIAKLRTSANQASNYRYLGVAAKIYRGLATDAGPFSQIADLDSPTPPTPPGSANLVRWTSQDYATGLSGNPSKYFATSTKMLKDNGTTTQNWGINAPSRPVICGAVPGRINTVDVAGVGHVTWVSGKQFPSTLEGQKFNIGSPGSEVEYTVATWTDATHLILTGSTGTQTSVRWRVPSTDVLTPYDYLMTFRNDVTGLEGNPSIEMIESKHIPADGSIVTLTTYGTDDPQISTLASHKTIAIYRRGGVFSDGLYRRLGFVTNNGLGAASFPAFVDDVEDSSLINAEILELDNDPPVSSNLAIPFTAVIASANPSVAITPGISTVLSLTVITPAGLTNLSNILRAGSPLTVGTGDTQETCIIEAVGGISLGAFDVRVWVQFPHQNGDIESVSADYVVNEPCKLSCQAFGSMFLAGDKNNPHILYKSKSARPEAWPIVNLSNGASGNIVVGSPSNPIMALSEFGGEVLVMNLSSLNIVRVWNGVMQAPIETPAKRGLLASFAWCKVGNAIWYLAYDGIYSWEGGMEQKRSEAINPIFMGQTVNGIAPMDMSPGNGTPGDAANALQYVNFEYHDHEVNVVYRDTIGNTHRLRYSVIYDRWYIRDDGHGALENGFVAVNAMHLDEDTGNLVLGKYVNNLGQTFLEYDNLGSSDSWISAETDGGAISITAFTAFYNLGAPAMNKHYGDLVLELDNDLCVNLTVSLFWDFAGTVDGTNANDVIIIPSVTSGSRRTVAIGIKNSAGLLTGHDARALAIKITGSSTRPLTLYSMTFNAFPLELQQRGRAFDWDDLGWPNEKNLKELFVEYDFSQVVGGGPVTLCMDAKSGIDGTVETLNVQTWSLSGTGRCRQNLAVQKDVILKLVRLRPVFSGGQTTSYMFWDYKFTQDNWPPDVTLATPWNDNNSPYDKYYQQVDIEIDTGGVSCNGVFQIDGANAETLPSFSTTNGLRTHFSFTLNPNLKGKFARLLFTPGTAGKAQLFSHKFIALPADPGEVMHSFPWSDEGHPFDKRFKTITFEYELSGGGTVVMQLDTITGVKGSTINTNVQQFTLDGSGRSKFTGAFNDGIVCKMIRLYPTAATYPFLKNWKYVVDKIQYPADVVRFSGEADNLGYPCEKLLRELTLEMDTGGVACSVGVELDGTVAHTFSITTTANDKTRMITMPSRAAELRCLLARLLFTPGTGGKSQYFNHTFNRTLLPCRVTHWSSFETSWGGAGYKFMKQMFVTYESAVPIVISIYVADRILFYQKTLPAHAGRDTERFYLPAKSGSVLNMSKEYAVDIDSSDGTTGFYLYRDSSRCELRETAAEQRSAFLQRVVYFDLPIQK